MKKVDICIIGAGPGGATAALHLSNKGIRSLLVDKAVFPRDKICGDALSGKVVSELKRINPDLVGRLESRSVSSHSWGVHFIAPDNRWLSVPFRYAFDKTRDAAPGYVTRRLDFDQFLLDEVRQRPEIELAEGVEVAAYERGADGYIVRDKGGSFEVHARMLIIANGAQSNFSRHVAGIPVEPAHYCAGLRAYYRNVSGLDANGFVELHFLESLLPGYLWIFPLPGGYANVGVGMRSDRIKARKINLKEQMLSLLGSHPALAGRFANAELSSEIKGFGLPLGSKKRAISGERYVLTGDAAHLIDPFTGEGISNAMISGRWAAEQAQRCLLAGDFSARYMQQYDQAVYRRLGNELQISYQLQKLLSYPWLFNFIARRAAANPTLARTISCMFTDVDLRRQFRSPAFYAKLLFNHQRNF